MVTRGQMGGDEEIKENHHCIEILESIYKIFLDTLLINKYITKYEA